MSRQIASVHIVQPFGVSNLARTDQGVCVRVLRVEHLVVFVERCHMPRDMGDTDLMNCAASRNSSFES